MKRTVERVVAGAEAGDPPADLNDDVPAAAPAQQQRRGRGNKALEQTAKEREREEREFTSPEPTASEQGHQSLRDILARAEGSKKPKAEAKPEPEPVEDEPEEDETPPENDNPDDDAHPPGDDDETPVPEAEAKPVEKKADEVEYLTPAQRKELNTKLSEKRRERELETELKKAQAERDALKAKAGGSLDDRLSIVGKSREELLEELLVGGGQPAEAAADMTPREREMATRLAALEKVIADSQKQQTTVQVQQLQAGALTKIKTLVTAEHFPMVAAMGAFEDVLTEGEGLYDPAEEDGKGYGLRVMQVAADNIEQKLRAKYPTIAAKVAAAADAPASDQKPTAKPKPTMGSRSAPASKAPTDGGADLPFDESRHAAVKERFFGRAHR